MTTRIADTATVIHQTVRSRDGATISYLTQGSGAAVIVIPGALSTAATYATFATTFADHFTVHTIERRGRGQSSPQGVDYSITKECEDVLALQQATGATMLVGHSYGGLVALETARNNPAITKVAVYEPGVSVDGAIPMGWMVEYTKKLNAKKYADAFVAFIRDYGPPIARLLPAWYMKLLLPLILPAEERKVRLSLLPENLREHQEVARLDNSYANYREITADVLLMYGGYGGNHTPLWVRTSMERLTEVLPHAQTQKFPRLDHFGIDKQDPREVARCVGAFFSDE